MEELNIAKDGLAGTAGPMKPGAGKSPYRRFVEGLVTRAGEEYPEELVTEEVVEGGRDPYGLALSRGGGGEREPPALPGE